MFLPSLAKIAKKSSLQTVLIVPFVRQIVATVGLVGYLSLRKGQRAINELATQLRTESTLLIPLHLHNALKESQRLNHINVDAMKLGNLNNNDFSILLRHFFRQIQLKISRSGQAFIIEHFGGLVATSTDEHPYIPLQKQGEQGKRLNAIASRNEITRQAAAIFMRKPPIKQIQPQPKQTLEMSSHQKLWQLCRQNYWQIKKMPP